MTNILSVEIFVLGNTKALPLVKRSKIKIKIKKGSSI